MSGGTMEDKTPDSLVEERVAQLQVISERRNALLRQMFHMVQRRQSVGSVIKLEDEEGDEELAVFLDRFDLAKKDRKHPEPCSKRIVLGAIPRKRRSVSSPFIVPAQPPAQRAPSLGTRSTRRCSTRHTSSSRPELS
ncbi:hypothetical protein B0H11DRAFT_395548 [Mycena galericulata]|nr:hypothetical protein B0H11DRAFT_395548 [Mycena galericulata]